jgi:hypothetical protein
MTSADKRQRSAIMHSQSRALTAIGIFLFFGAVMASLAGTTLLWRGTILEWMWALNPTAYKQLVPFGAAAGIPFLLLGVALSVAVSGDGGWRWPSSPHRSWVTRSMSYGAMS